MARPKKTNSGSSSATVGINDGPKIDAERFVDAIFSDPGAGIDLAKETLTGDIRDFILDRIKHEQDKRPWDQRSEADQQFTVNQVEGACQRLVERAVEIIAAGGRKAIKATLEQVTFKDGIKATISLSKFDEMRHALADSQGSTIVIFVADPEEFSGERAPAKIRPDQPALPMAVHSSHDDDRHDNPLN